MKNVLKKETSMYNCQFPTSSICSNTLKVTLNFLPCIAECLYNFLVTDHFEWRGEPLSRNSRARRGTELSGSCGLLTQVSKYGILIQVNKDGVLAQLSKGGVLAWVSKCGVLTQVSKGGFSNR